MLGLIIVGFVMMTIGVALLCLGEVPFIGGKRIPAMRSRSIGLVFVSFLPLAWGVRQATIALFEPDAVQGPVVSWSLFGLCWFVAFLILFRVLVPKRERRTVATRTSSAADKNPFGIAEPEEEAIEPAATRKPAKKPQAKKPRADEANDTFDFT